MNIFLNEYFGFGFELNHFHARFNEKMNFQKRSPTPRHRGIVAIQGNYSKKMLPLCKDDHQSLKHFSHLSDLAVMVPFWADKY